MKKRPRKQNPFFSFFTTYPGGTELENPDCTDSKGIDLGADGRPGDPLEITDTDQNGTVKVLTKSGDVFNSSGGYLLTVLNLINGQHTFRLRANSSSLPSDQWMLTIDAAEPLTIDTTEMKLNGIMIVNPYGWPTNEMAGNTATRIARGGVPPYSYMSANTQVAQVVSSSGKVTGLKNGITTITVADAANQRVSYSVQVSNVYRLLVNNALLTAEEGRAWIQSVGGENSYNITGYVSPSLVNPVRDLYENRLYPDPLGSRIFQYTETQVNFLCWNGSYIGGLGLLYGDSKRIRAFACIAT